MIKKVCFINSAIIENSGFVGAVIHTLGTIDSIFFINTTISGNSSIVGETVISLHGGYTQLFHMKNSIYWDNSGEGDSGEDIFETYDGDYYYSIADITYSILSDPYFYNTDIYEGVFGTDPLFIDFDNGNFHLQAESPCIDAGDPDSPLDPDGTIADMGAFYYDQSPGILGDLNQDEVIDILDIVITINIILGDEPTEYEQWAGDLNSDGEINVLDVELIVNIILEI